MHSNRVTLPHLLVVDDDERLRHLLVKFLKENGFYVSQAADAEEAYAIIERFRFDLMVLDIMMPGDTGLVLTKKLRTHSYDIPILLLTAMGEVESRIEGLKCGADDYLPKPFEPEELLLRIQAILKRVQQTNATLLYETAIGPFQFHYKKGLLRKGQDPLPLTDAEIKILRVLVDHKNTPISREDLIQETKISSNFRTIDVNITRLRKKLEEDPKNPKLLQTVRHKGYILWTE